MDIILKVIIKRTKHSLKNITGSHYFYDWHSFAQFRIQGKNEKMYVLILYLFCQRPPVWKSLLATGDTVVNKKAMASPHGSCSLLGEEGINQVLSHN